MEGLENQQTPDKPKFPLPPSSFKIIESTYYCFNNYVIGSGSFGKVIYSINILLTQSKVNNIN